MAAVDVTAAGFGQHERFTAVEMAGFYLRISRRSFGHLVGLAIEQQKEDAMSEVPDYVLQKAKAGDSVSVDGEEFPRWYINGVPCLMNCRLCGIQMQQGVALLNSPSYGVEDFIGQTDTRGQTFTMGGPPSLVPVMKCPKCGHSVVA
jgi:hypothetical protein